MITAIEQSSSLLDYNGNLRDLLNQHRKKNLSDSDFVNAYAQLMKRAEDQEISYFVKFGTFAPRYTSLELLAGLKSDMAALTELSELQDEADLLRSGRLNIDDTHWQLSWTFLLSRGADLGHFWNSETKLFK